MPATKTLYYDHRSLYPERGDTVQVTIRTMQGEEERFEAVYMGVHQIEAYTTPYFIFCIDQTARFINANDVREITFALAVPPIPTSRQLPTKEADSEWTD